MSRRHLTLAVVAVASLVISACSAAPTSPISAPNVRSSDEITTPPTTPPDSTSLSGWISSNG